MPEHEHAQRLEKRRSRDVSAEVPMHVACGMDPRGSMYLHTVDGQIPA